MPGLNEQDREWLRLVAREIAFEVVKECLVVHESNCPHGRRWGQVKFLLIGAAVSAAAFGAGSGLGEFVKRLAVGF